MNKLTTMNNTQTMTSREIAEVVESRHDSVKRTIERLVDSGIFTLPPLVETSFLDSAGKKQHTTNYIIDKRTSYIVVAQLSPEFTARLVDRWQELEQQVTRPMTQLEAYKQLVRMEEEKLAMIETISSQAGVIETKQIITNNSNEYFTVNRVKELNPDMVFSGVKLTAKSNELGLPTTQLFAPYNMNVPNTYHSRVWNLVYPKAKLP